MTIYLDYIFIENFLIDYILLKETSYIARRQVSNTRVIISALVASIYVVVMLYLRLQEWNYLISKLLLVIVVIYISFKPKKFNEYIKITTCFFLISAINLGTLTVIMNLLNLQSGDQILRLVIYIVSLFFSRFFTNHMWRVYRQNVKNDNLIYEVTIGLNKKIYKYNAFLDTGNNVFSYTYNMPIIFAELLDDAMIKELKRKESFSIRTVTLSNEAEKIAYIFDKIQIRKKEKTWTVKAAIVFENTKLSKDNSYNMLLNYILYAQDLGGIKV